MAFWRTLTIIIWTVRSVWRFEGLLQYMDSRSVWPFEGPLQYMDITTTFPQKKIEVKIMSLEMQNLQSLSSVVLNVWALKTKLAILDFLGFISVLFFHITWKNWHNAYIYSMLWNKFGTATRFTSWSCIWICPIFRQIDSCQSYVNNLLQSYWQLKTAKS